MDPKIDALLASSRAAPADDGPRLVWADAVGGERGELVVLQCDLAKLPPSQAAARWHRVGELLDVHGERWSGLRGIATSCSFRRGFVEHIEIDLESCLAHAAQVAKAAPLLVSMEVRCVIRTGLPARAEGVPPAADPMPRIAELLHHPALRDVRGLVFHDAVHEGVPSIFEDTGCGDEIAALVIETNRIRNLTELGFINCGFSAAGLAAIAEHGANLERLQILETDASLLGLASGFPRLRALALRSLDADDVPHLPSTLIELEVGYLSQDGLAALAASPLAATLERFSCVEGTIPQATYDGFTSLREAPLDTVTLSLT